MYRIFAFDGVELPRYVQDNDSHNIGTGQALTSFQQISNGFFDNYGSRKSPQGIRPVTLSGVFHGASATDLMSQVDTLRAKLGTRGKLSAYFDDGSLRWQWARLQSINTPRQPENRLWLPFDMTFITASQIWYKVAVTPVEWTWGDLSWTFGDGTAEIGESGTLATLTETTGGFGQTFTITHSGNIDATNIAFTITAGTSTIEFWDYINNTRRDRMAGTTDIAAGEKVVINAGDRSAWHYGIAKNINFVFNNTGATATINATAHGLTTGDTVYIDGTNVFDGIHKNVTVLGSSSFTITSTKYSGSIFAGTIRKLTSVYNDFKTYNSKWPVLSPGSNSISLLVTGNATQDATVAWEYFAHYA